MAMVVRELMTLYASFLRGEEPALAEPAMQYLDYAEWQREWLAGERLEGQLAAWRAALAGAPTLLELPTDRPRPPRLDEHGAYFHVHLSRATRDAVAGFARQTGTTSFVVLLAAFVTLLSRLTGQREVLVGTPVANRPRLEIEETVGLFVNTLVLHGRVADEAGRGLSFAEVVARLRQAALAAFDNQDLPFERLVEALNLERSQAHTPLFQVMFNLQNQSVEAMEMPVLRVEPLPFHSATSMFELTLDLVETPDGYVGGLEYPTALFDETTIARWWQVYCRLLEGAIAAPAKPAARLALLGAGERRELLAEQAVGGQAAGPSGLAHRLFEAAARERPAHPAVIDGERSLSYAELDAHANQLAHWLRDQGVGAEERVGLCLGKSLALPIAVLATLKAGGCFVPLDPEGGGERLRRVLLAAQPRLVLAEAATRATLPGDGPPVFAVEALAASLEALAATGSAPPAAAVAPANLAYVIFTSGSTGTPKGVMVEHRSWVNATHAYRRAYEVVADAGSYLQVANPTFDVFAGDLARTLFAGGTLVLCPREAVLEPARLLALAAATGVRGIETVPAVVRSLLGLLADGVPWPASVDLLVLGAEAWYRDEHATLRGLLPATTAIYNSYGVSEATIDSTRFLAGDLAGLATFGTVPIGQAFAGTELWVVDGGLELLPAGVPGELYLGGQNLARGYLGQPALTAGRFVPHPWSSQGGSRLYRTGDRVRRLPSGDLEFLGRVDFQVKVRGLRIEPGEVEAALARHPAVAQALVTAPEAAPGERQLVAYVVARGGTELDLADLRAFAARELPAAMVPAALVPLAALPLSANGKVDRKALPDPDWTAAAVADFVPPSTEAEEALAEIWQQVLPVERIGAGDSFFALGGHSLLASQVVTRVRSAFDVDLPLRAIFEAPTLAELALVVEGLLIAKIESLSEEEIAELL